MNAVNSNDCPIFIRISLNMEDSMNHMKTYDPLKANTRPNQTAAGMNHV